MELGALSDAALMDLARQGSAPAFAVLLHRHGPAVRAAVARDADPTGAVIDTYVAAMRQLGSVPPDVPVGPWLLDLAAAEVRDPEPVPDGRLPDLPSDERDEIWAELDLRWPDGKVRRHVPPWVGWAALVVALVALGVLVPFAAVHWGVADDDDDLAWGTLRAEPFDDDTLVAEQETPDEEPEELEFELPSFDLTEVEPSNTDSAPPPPDPGPDPPPVVEEEADPDPEPEIEVEDAVDEEEGGGEDEGDPGDVDPEDPDDDDEEPDADEPDDDPADDDPGSEDE